ncbi:ATP-binding SpoIIE family protein phosphatase [Streptomyces diastaticus]|uniref:ATP-binding SpoIIE family protein phosphatase n=1 Tax=Streptomyces diastaticus TaxID=1956 RepID=UPI00344B113B
MAIGTTLDVGRTAEELAEAMVPGFADLVTVDLAASVLRGEEPAGREETWCRVASRDIHGNRVPAPSGGPITFAPGSPQLRSLATGQALMKSELLTTTWWRGGREPEGAQGTADEGLHSLITVPLTARGVVLGVVGLWRSENPQAFEEDDLALAEEMSTRAAVCIENARRYVREHTTATTLQRSLLPRDVPDHTAVEVAHRYRPTGEGGGGDWFDVIPLSGTRVALVVGDVVGHGLYATATMGRLRTAVHNFSVLDLPPDELLSRLDELVDRNDTRGTVEETIGHVSGATCLYSIYDPTTGTCIVARAGHPPPVVVDDEGVVRSLEVPASPSLGMGRGLPFEAAEFQLPEGSRLVLYTDGLVRDRDPDLLHTTLACTAGLTPEETCTRILETMVVGEPQDDIALLVARTNRLDPAQTAQWRVPADPAAVASVRSECLRQLEQWGLGEISYATELILSELITNAVRYGAEPIRVRMLYDRTLICEVFDASSTAPHLRRAATTDEGGRGLFLVAQLTERWGTRYFARGKVIWAEQPLNGEAMEPNADATEALLEQWGD